MNYPELKSKTWMLTLNSMVNFYFIRLNINYLINMTNLYIKTIACAVLYITWKTKKTLNIPIHPFICPVQVLFYSTTNW